MAHWPSATQWNLGAEAWSNERELIRAAQHGDKAAFQQLIFRYDRLVLALGLHVTRSEEEARRIYERVFVTAFRRLPDANAEASFFIWIYRIAARCCQDYLQGEARPASRTSRWRRTCTKTPEGAPAKDTTQEGVLLSRLSVRERLVFVLAQYSRLRLRTIAEILNIPEASVQDALARAFYKLNTERAA